MKGNSGKLQQVFLNLFLNARDAMESGGALAVATRSDEDGFARIQVADTGQGIPPEHLARIYDPFFTTKAARKGTGLGLAVTYGIVREHGGNIEVESRPGAGSRFQVEIPSGKKAGACLTSCLPTPQFPHFPNRILVIDDEADIRESLETLLTWKATCVDLAANGTEGLRKVEAGNYDLVLLDLMMPDRSGMEVLSEIRERDTETPVFMITAYGSVEVAVSALKAGANDYFSKPWDNEKLLIEIDRMIAHRGWSARTSSSSAPSSSATAFPTSSARATGCCGFSTW